MAKVIKADIIEDTETTQQSVSTELMTIDTLLTIKGRKAFELFSDPENLRPYINIIRKEATSTIYNPAVKKDHEAIGSTARKVSQTKTALVAAIKDSIKTEEAKVKTAKGVAKFIEAELSDLRNEVLEPRNKFDQEQKEKEQARIQAIENRIANIRAIADLDGTESREEVGTLIDAVESMNIDESFQELSADANKAVADVKQALNERLFIIIEREQALENEKKLQEERKRSQIQERLSNLMMMPTKFIGKSSDEVKEQIQKLEKFQPSPDDFMERHGEAVSAMANVIAQLKMIQSQAEQMEQFKKMQDEQAAQAAQAERDAQAAQDQRDAQAAQAEREAQAVQAALADKAAQDELASQAAQAAMMNIEPEHHSHMPAHEETISEHSKSPLNDHDHTIESINGGIYEQQHRGFASSDANHYNTRPLEQATAGHFKHEKKTQFQKSTDFAIERLMTLCQLDESDASVIVAFIQSGEIPPLSFNE